MDPQQRAALILGCQQAVHRSFMALDMRDHAALAAGFAADGVWHRQGKVLRGPAEILAALEDRPAGRVTAHLVQNLVVEPQDERTASLRYLTLVHRHDFPAAPEGPAPLGAPLSIAVQEERMRREGDTWLTVERRSRRLFGG